ncbi:resolvase [Pectobacterium carotovorum subsp. carotovorum ICMP 5702]|nr:resolvase [Pectobacterium carotovorum subsp. carotovorum ICMP 5702]
MSQISRSALDTIATPAINFELALSVRQLAVMHRDFPKYLLEPEVTLLLSQVANLRQRMLFDLIWNTGARLNEALALTPDDIHLDARRPYIKLTTLKQQRTRKPGRPEKGRAFRDVPILDGGFAARLGDFLATFCKWRTKPIWHETDDTARNWLATALTRCADQGIALSVPVTPHTLRHSFAMHLLYCQAAPLTLQAYMGHADFKSTQVYLRVLALEAGIGGHYQVRFGMSTDDAAALLRQAGQLRHDK